MGSIVRARRAQNFNLKNQKKYKSKNLKPASQPASQPDRQTNNYAYDTLHKICHPVIPHICMGSISSRLDVIEILTDRQTDSQEKKFRRAICRYFRSRAKNYSSLCKTFLLITHWLTRFLKNGCSNLEYEKVSLLHFSASRFFPPSISWRIIHTDVHISIDVFGDKLEAFIYFPGPRDIGRKRPSGQRWRKKTEDDTQSVAHVCFRRKENQSKMAKLGNVNILLREPRKYSCLVSFFGSAALTFW